MIDRYGRMTAIALIVVLVLPGLPHSGFVAAAQEASGEAIETYTVRRGDTLFSISRRFGLTITQLREINGLTSNDISLGQVLRLKGTPPPADSSAVETAISEESANPHAEELEALARATGTSLAGLLNKNPELESGLSPGAIVVLSDDINEISYVVRRGDTLFSIARSHSITAELIRQRNNLPGNNIRIGQTLVLSTRAVASSGSASSEVFMAEVYPDGLSDRTLSSGVRYEERAFLVSHPTLAYGSVVMVGIPGSDHVILAVVSDRASPGGSRLVSVSAALATAVNADDSDIVELEITRVHDGFRDN